MKVAIIGCTHAGIAAMKQILKYYPGTEITVYERHADISYMSCGTYLHLGNHQGFGSSTVRESD
ncbi:FAD/NAD(P)-binding oxidoreductase [Lactiplantibacillus argentoratensis]|uniref:FAD/NAD(P)-binding oxidoreductase n=1 Tax=Lactiplantibacillus argentoratensis TaxID=271881 RepID=UPI001FD5B339|nr:FAD/NAD(P)-binding oxidoreductase [Lactiplantibacillus argentoratensis]